jgi:hypothetical protein
MDLHKAIFSIHTNTTTINGDTQDTIVAKDSDGNEININWTQVNAWIDPEQYKLNRQLEFDKKSIQDQLDMQYHDAVNGTNTWKDWVKSIKEAYPKP